MKSTLSLGVVLFTMCLTGILGARESLEQEPTLEETQNFLNDFTINRDTDWLPYFWTQNMIRFLPKDIVNSSHTCTEVKYDLKDENNSAKTELTFQVQDIETNSVRELHQLVEVSCRQAACMNVDYPERHENGEELRSRRERRFYVRFANDNESERYIRGISHLTKLCGGSIKKLFE